MRALALGVALLPVAADAHAAMVQPRPRNAIEGTIAPWNAGSVPEFEPVSGQNEQMSTWCPIASGEPGKTGVNNSDLSGALGQACFWFS